VTLLDGHPRSGGDRNGHGSRVCGAARVRPGQRYPGHGVHHRNSAGNGTRLVSATSERPSQQLVTVSFFLLTAYIVGEAIHRYWPFRYRDLGLADCISYGHAAALAGPWNPAGSCGGRGTPIGRRTI